MRKVELHAILTREATEAPNPRGARIVSSRFHTWLVYECDGRYDAAKARDQTVLLTTHRAEGGATERAAVLSRWVDEQDIISPRIDPAPLIVAMFYAMSNYDFNHNLTPRQQARIMEIIQNAKKS